jgi:hypothetical protein
MRGYKLAIVSGNWSSVAPNKPGDFPTYDSLERFSARAEWRFADMHRIMCKVGEWGSLLSGIDLRDGHIEG